MERVPRVFLDFRVREGGIGRYGRELAAGLRALDVETRVFEGDGRFARLTHAPFTPWGRSRVAAAAARWNAALIHGLHLEIPRSDRPLVATVHDLIPLEYAASMPSAARRLVYRRILDASLRRAARVIVPSDATASSLRRHGCEHAKVVVIPHGVSAAFRPLSDGERDEARARFAGGRRYVVAATGAKPHKNAAGADEAAALVTNEADVDFLAAGHPIRGVKHIRFVGRLSDEELRSFYGGADALVLASHVEGFGLPALEAVACGTPVVCGCGTGALAYIRPGAIEVDVRRADEIAVGVRRILDDHDLRADLARAGRAAATSLSAEAMARAHLTVYEDVLAQPLALR